MVEVMRFFCSECFVNFFSCVMVFFLCSCGSVSIEDAPIQISKPGKIEKVPKHQRHVYLKIKDSSGNAAEIATALEGALEQSGYVFVPDGDPFTFRLFINVLKFGDGDSLDYKLWKGVTNEKKYADKSVVAEVELVGPKTNIKTKIITGVNFTKTLFKKASPELLEKGSERLEKVFAKAVLRLFK